MVKCKHCDKEAVAKGLCSKHLDYYYNAGNDIGVYKLIFKDNNKIYIGSTVEQGFSVRKSKHKYELTKGLVKLDSTKKLLGYFNQLCAEHLDLSREQVFDEYVDLVPLEKTSKFIPIESDDKGFRMLNDKQSKRESYILSISENDDIKKAIKDVDSYFRNREKWYIDECKKADLKNGTDYCLNERR